MQAAQRPDWAGRTVACLASGPSLTQEDCDAVRGIPTVVTNTSFRLAPWADILFGFDSKWWRQYLPEVREVFKGRLLCNSQIASNLGVETTYASTWFRGFGNSGACAISLAVGAGATRIVLLGFDCGFGLSGQKHWHGDHPAGFTNCASIAKWPKQFDQVAEYARSKGVHVVNASRQTILRCFEQQTLERALGVAVEA